MQMDHPEEYMILMKMEKNDDAINEEKVDCARMQQLSIESRPVEILETQWDNEKQYLQLRKEKKVIFKDDMSNMKIEINHNY